MWWGAVNVPGKAWLAHDSAGAIRRLSSPDIPKVILNVHSPNSHMRSGVTKRLCWHAAELRSFLQSQGAARQVLGHGSNIW